MPTPHPPRVQDGPEEIVEVRLRRKFSSKKPTLGPADRALCPQETTTLATNRQKSASPTTHKRRMPPAASAAHREASGHSRRERRKRSTIPPNCLLASNRSRGPDGVEGCDPKERAHDRRQEMPCKVNPRGTHQTSAKRSAAPGPPHPYLRPRSERSPSSAVAGYERARPRRCTAFLPSSSSASQPHARHPKPPHTNGKDATRREVFRAIDGSAR